MKEGVMPEHYTQEHEGKVGTIGMVEEAKAAHHLASADPEKDGLMTGPEHEEKYGLERAPESAAIVQAQEAYSSGDPEKIAAVETATAGKAPETAAAPRASDSK